MKNIIFGLLFILCGYCARAQQINFYLNVNDCSICSVKLQEFSSYLKNNAKLQYSIFIDANFQEDSSLIYEKFNLDELDQRRVKWLPTEPHDLDLSAGSVIYFEGIEQYYPVKSMKLEELKQYLDSYKKSTVDFCDIGQSMPKNIKLLSCADGQICVFNKYNSTYYFVDLNSSQIDTVLLSSLLEEEVFVNIFGEKKGRLYFAQTTSSKFGNLPKNWLTSYHFNDEKQTHNFICTIFYPKYIGGDLDMIAKAFALITFNASLDDYSILPIPVADSIGIYEITMMMYKNELFTAIQNPDHLVDSNFYYIYSYALENGMISPKMQYNIQLPKIHKDFGVAYNNLNFLSSGKFATLPFSDYYIDLETMKDESFNWDVEVIESMRDILQKRSGSLPYSIWDLKSLDAHRMMLILSKYDEMQVGVFDSRNKSFSLLWKEKGEFSLMPKFVKMNEGDLGIVYRKKAKCFIYTTIED